MKSLKQFLLEKEMGGDNVLYHTANMLYAGIGIVESGKIGFSMVNGVEQEIIYKAYPSNTNFKSYLSTSRSLDNDFVKQKMKLGIVTTFVLKADEIKHNRIVVPINYLEGDRKGGSAEQEERVLSTKETDFLDLKRYCKECFVWLKNPDNYFFNPETEMPEKHYSKYIEHKSYKEKENNFYFSMYGMKFLSALKKYDFPVWGFEADQKQEFLAMRTENAFLIRAVNS